MSIKNSRIIVKPLDFFFFFLFLVAIILFFNMIITGQKKLVAEISCGSEVFEYDLSLEKKFKVKGILGETEISIQDGNVFITDSPCRNKTCIHQGKISRNGQWLCCAPNQVIIIIKGQDQNNASIPDAVSF